MAGTKLVRPPRLVGFGGRPYNFFDRDAVVDDIATPLGGGSFRCAVLVEGALVIGDSKGNLSFTDSELQVVVQGKLFGGPAHFLAKSKQNPPLFVVVGSEDDGSLWLKTWLGSQIKTPLHSLDLGAQLKAQAGSKLQASALAVNHDGTKIVVGFSSGAILLLEGDFNRERSKLKPPMILRPAGASPVAVVALHFLQPDSTGDETGGGGVGVASPPTSLSQSLSPSAALSKLYVIIGDESSAGVEGTGILVYNTADLKARPVGLDDQGCGANCSAVDPSTQDLIVGRSDAMFFYSEEEGRKGALGFEVKQCLTSLSGSSILVTSIDEQSQRTVINVYDLRNKFVAFHTTLPPDQRVVGLIAEGSLAYVVTSQGHVFRLREKDISAKLKLLVDDMKLYGVAIKLAYSSNYDVNKIMEIYKLYGNYLYSKKRAYDAAIKQYCNTIGYLDPSYVISRFLDAQRIKNLTYYLEALHRRGHATADLTTFLLNCYTKLKDVEKLDQFINPERVLQAAQSEGAGSFGQPSSTAEPEIELEPPADSMLGDTVNTAASRRRSLGSPEEEETAANFDIQTAIGVLKSAGYLDHALELARKYKAHEWYLRIQLEKPSPSYRDALQYISGLPFEAAEQHLRTYGKKLMNHLPEETTGLIMALCTGRYRPALTGDDDGGMIRPVGSGGTSTMDPVDASRGGGAMSPPPPKAKAENFMHLYVDHPQWLRTFLECVIKEPGLQVSVSVANTLLELLLQECEATLNLPADDPTRSHARRQKEGEVMAFLDQQHGRYDEDHALVLVQMHKFKPGQLFLHDKMRNVELVLDHYIAERDTSMILNRIGRKENKKNPDLWIKVLNYVVDEARRQLEEWRTRVEEGEEEEDEDEEEAIWDDTIKVLQMLDKEQVLPPLTVIEILSQNDSIPLFVVKDYISKLLKEAYGDLNASQEKIDSLRQSTAEMRAEVTDLRSTARVFQATKCNGCPKNLDLPAVHFLCMHSYHLDQNCLDNENECNECAPDHRKYEGIRKGQSDKAMDHEHFFSELEEHGFSAVATFFGKGVIR